MLDVNNVLANGQFGDVISGKVNNQPCQVHVVSDDMEPLDQSQFLRDLDTVRKFGPHKNVIDFYGVCQTANWLYLLFEHTPMSLKTMLIESRTPPTTNKYSFSSLSEAFILRTLYELSTAMEYLHSFKVNSSASFLFIRYLLRQIFGVPHTLEIHHDFSRCLFSSLSTERSVRTISVWRPTKRPKCPVSVRRPSTTMAKPLICCAGVHPRSYVSNTIRSVAMPGLLVASSGNAVRWAAHCIQASILMI